MNSLFKGCGTALVTPFRKDFSIDGETLRSLVNRQIESGIDFVVPCGTTGESPTLSKSEYREVVSLVVEEAKNKVPVLVGAGGYNTQEVVELCRFVKEVGADGVLSVTPYYNKPTQEGLFHHYKAIAESTSLPIILYNIQGRTNVNINVDTMMRLAKIPNIIGVKEASANIGQMATIASQMPDDFLLLSGDDSTALPLIALGGHGLISVAANAIPNHMSQLVHLSLAGDFAKAREIQKKYVPFMDINFVETNPSPIKAAMSLMGLLEPVLRLPMVMPQPANLEKISKILESLGLLDVRFAVSAN